MKFISVLVTICIIVCILVSGCITVNPNNEEKLVETSQNGIFMIEWRDVFNNGDAVYKLRITEDNVTCYTFDNYHGGGISCLRDEE